MIRQANGSWERLKALLLLKRSHLHTNKYPFKYRQSYQPILLSNALEALSAYSVVILFITSSILCFGCSSPFRTDNATLLSPNVDIEKELANGESHSFRVSLQSGQYSSVTVEQRGIDVLVAVYGPDDKPIAEMDGPYGNRGTESVSLLAESPGDYRVEVRPAKNQDSDGLYNITIQEPRISTEEDRVRVNGERAFMDGRKLTSQPQKELWQQAVEKYKEALSDWRGLGDKQEAAKTTYATAIILRRLEKMEEAVSYGEQSLSLHRAVEDRRGEGLVLVELGLTSAFFNQREALKYLLQALPVLREQEDKAEEARALNILGGVHDNIGEPHKALEYYRQSLAIRQVIKDLRGEASTLNNIGVIYDEFGESRKSLKQYSEALSVLDKLPDLSLNDRRTKANTLNNVGYTYLALGDPEKSLYYCNQSLQLQKETNNRRFEARTLINIGYAYISKSDPQKAIDSYNEALKILKEIKDVWGQANTLTYLGQAFASLGKQRKALQKYNRALKLQKTIEDPQGKALVFDRLGKVYTATSQPEKALEYYQNALSLWRAIEDRRGEATTLLGIAYAERNLGNLSASRSRVEAAIEIIEFLRMLTPDQESRTIYFASVQPYYNFYIDLLMTMHRKNPRAGLDSVALLASERARARSLQESLIQAQTDTYQGIDPALSQSERNLQEREYALRQLLRVKTQEQIILLRGLYTQQQEKAKEKEIEDLLAQYRETLMQYQDIKERIDIKGSPQVALLQVKEIQQQLLDSDTMMLEYSLGDERSYLWAITQRSIKSYELLGRQALESQAALVYKWLTDRQPVDGETLESRNERCKQADSNYWEDAEKLSQMLLGPVVSQLGKKRLLIVPDGALYYVPFPALPVPSGKEAKGTTAETQNDKPVFPNRQPLVVEHEIASLPSASVQAIMRRKSAERPPASNQIAVFADPVFRKDDDRVIAASNEKLPDGEVARSEGSPQDVINFGETRDGFNLPRLLSLRREADDIMAMAPAGKNFKALDFDANLVNATSGDLGQYSIVHFATHGLLNNEHPELSAIVLSLVDRQGRSQDGLLQLHDIYNMNLLAELVVLSACDTGLGKQIKGEGIIGLTRGFLYAGARRVVASLWKVDSVQTENLMKLFYRGMLVEKLRPLKALQNAQIKMWMDRPQEAPYSWAAFILQGEWK